MGNYPVRTLAFHALLVAVGVTGAVGDIFLYKWAKLRGPGWLLASFALWLVSVTLLGYFLRWERFTFSAAIVLAMIIHVGIAVICDLAYFGGRLSRTEWLGVLFAVIAVVLLEVGRENAEDDHSDPPQQQNSPGD